MRTFLGIWISIAVLVSAGVTRADGPPDRHLIEKTASGKINWTTGWIFASGVGVPPPNVGGVQARAMAERAAFNVALRNLLETVKGIRVDSMTLVENFMLKDDAIKTQVSGFVKGAQVVKDKTVVQPDGTVELVVKVPLWGAESLYVPMMNAKGMQPRDGSAAEEEGDGYSGVVIDARGLGVLPACFPELHDPDGGVIFGPDTVDRATAEKDGMVHYMTVPKGQELSTLLDRAMILRPVEMAAPKAVMPREGRRPLRIKGLDKGGSFKANVIISREDARKIQNDPRIASALRRSRVTIVTDPLIGGMQGKTPGELFAVNREPGTGKREP